MYTFISQLLKLVNKDGPNVLYSFYKIERRSYTKKGGWCHSKLFPYLSKAKIMQLCENQTPTSNEDVPRHGSWLWLLMHVHSTELSRDALSLFSDCCPKYKHLGFNGFWHYASKWNYPFISICLYHDSVFYNVRIAVRTYFFERRVW